MDERERVQEVFAGRDRSGVTRERYSFFNRANLHFIQERERELLALLAAHGYDAGRLAGCRALAIGCGHGAELLDLVRYGATPRLVTGVELEAGRVRVARSRNPAFGIARADAGALPFAGAGFDLVLQFTVLSSVLDPASRRGIAAEMLRVLGPGGTILWYDFWADNPRNPDVRGIGAREIRGLFPGCACDIRRLTLPPPLARALVPVSWLLADLLARTRLFGAFHLAAIRRR